MSEDISMKTLGLEKLVAEILNANGYLVGSKWLSEEFLRQLKL